MYPEKKFQAAANRASATHCGHYEAQEKGSRKAAGIFGDATDGSLYFLNSKRLVKPVTVKILRRF